MAGKKRFAINVVMNWSAMAVGMVVPFFLTPFVVRHLGQDAYGVWILAVSTVSYLALLDLGLRSAIVRFVSKGTAEGKVDDVQKAIGGALWVRLGIAGGVALISVGLAAWFPHLFKLEPALQRAGQITVLLCAIGVAISLVSGVFGGVLSGNNRFDILSSITIGQTLARAIGVIVILRTGHGLVALAYWELTVVLLSGLTTWGSAMKIYPPCRARFARPHADTLRMIWSYSFKTFIISVAVQIVFYTDNLVVGHFLSVAVVSLYSFAGTLAMASGQASTAMGAVFIPMASRLDTSGQTNDLRKLLVRGTQASLGLMLPIGITLLLRGKTFMGLWVGPQYSETSGTILQILLISQFFTIANSTAGQIAYGVDKHKSVATWAAIEAVFNLGLSLILVKRIGIYGVAWGTSISQVIIHMIFWPRYIKKELAVPVRTYIWMGWMKITFCSVPFAIACFLADKHWHAASMAGFFGQVFALLPVYVLSVLIGFPRETESAYRQWSASRLSSTHATL
jgi:O-antigen/teichoic acid export membrane protein